MIRYINMHVFAIANKPTNIFAGKLLLKLLLEIKNIM